MKEILAGELDLAIKENNLNAIKTFETKTHLSDKTQIWELSDEDFIKLCDFPDDEWKDGWGWWRSADGSNLGLVEKRYNINGHYINAWDGDYRKECESGDEEWYRDRKYNNLLEYFCDEIGASTEKNVCALAVDLAKQKNIKMSELFSKYQG